jgi:hypothetical protein
MTGRKTADVVKRASSERMSADGVWGEDDYGNQSRVSGRSAGIGYDDVSPTSSAVNGAADASSALMTCLPHVIRRRPPSSAIGGVEGEGNGNVQVHGTYSQKTLDV